MVYRLPPELQAKHDAAQRELPALVARGLKRSEIAAALGVSVGSLSGMIFRAGLVPEHRRRSTLPDRLPQQVEAVRACVERGMTVTETAEATGLSYDTVRNRARVAGVKFQTKTPAPVDKPPRRRRPANEAAKSAGTARGSGAATAPILPSPATAQAAVPPATAVPASALATFGGRRCEYVFGERPNYLYCGAPCVGRTSYCEEHARLVYWTRNWESECSRSNRR